MLVFLLLISESWVPFISTHKHSMDLHKLRQHADMKAFWRLFGALHFSLLYYRKRNDRVLYPTESMFVEERI